MNDKKQLVSLLKKYQQIILKESCLKEINCSLKERKKALEAEKDHYERGKNFLDLNQINLQVEQRLSQLNQRTKSIINDYNELKFKTKCVACAYKQLREKVRYEEDALNALNVNDGEGKDERADYEEDNDQGMTVVWLNQVKNEMIQRITQEIESMSSRIDYFQHFNQYLKPLMNDLFLENK